MNTLKGSPISYHDNETKYKTLIHVGIAKMLRNLTYIKPDVLCIPVP